MSNKLNKVRHNENDIVIDDGSKVYNIKNRQGKILSQFSFRPTDTNIVDRYEEVRKFLEEFNAPEGVTAEEVEHLFIEKLDYLVDANTKETFFSIMGPFSPMPDGRLFIEACIDAICGIIGKEFDVRMRKTQSRISKYTQKYHG